MPSQYKVQGVIGVGGTATVLRAYDELNNRSVVVKQLLDRENSATLKREIKSLSILRHNNIISILDYSPRSLVLEDMQMDLLDVIQTREYCFKSLLNTFIDICKAVDHCHSKNIAHFDIKPENILIGKDGTVKLCDFGGSIMWSPRDPLIDVQSSTITPYYSAPEVNSRKKVLGVKADSWSLGILLHVIFTGTWPFGGRSESEVARNVVMGELSISDVFPESLLPLLKGLLRFEPNERLSPREVIEKIELNGSSSPRVILRHKRSKLILGFLQRFKLNKKRR